MDIYHQIDCINEIVRGRHWQTLLDHYKTGYGESFHITHGGLLVKPSNIPGAGLGLFSLVREIEAGDVVCEFKGRYSKEGSKEHNNYEIVARFPDKSTWTVDPTHGSGNFDIQTAIRTNNFAPFANEPPPDKVANVISVAHISKRYEVRLVATQKISCFEEIYLMYSNLEEQADYRIGKQADKDAIALAMGRMHARSDVPNVKTFIL
jgi:hypothetical protein